MSEGMIDGYRGGVIMDLFCGRWVDLAGVALCCHNSFLVNHFTGTNISKVLSKYTSLVRNGEVLSRF